MRVGFLVCLCSLVAGCYENHLLGGAGTPDARASSDAAVRPDTAVDANVDAFAWPDAVGGLFLDGGELPRGDAGVRPLPDAGPPGDALGDEWNGYVAGVPFPSGSDHVRIVFDAPNGVAPRTGFIVFGDETLPGSPIDPNVGYEPHGASFGQLVEGFRYHFVDGDVTASRIRSSYDLAEPWQPWCAMQYPVASTPGGTDYTCVPGGMGRQSDRGCEYLDPYTNAWTGVDCGRFALCSFAGHACSCTAAGCTASSGFAPIELVDLHVTGDTAEGGGTYLTRS